MRRFLLTLLLLLLPAFAQAQVTQRDWALQLIDSLGWSFGLPEKPTDADYSQMLSGRRVYRIEAEETYQRADRVAVMKFDTFGPFSGEGWLNGTKARTQAHLKFNLPHTGHYRVNARVRLTGHHLVFGMSDFLMSGGGQFTDVNVGDVELQAGPQEVILQLQPNGSIDYFELVAEPFEPIAPEGGWRFDEELTAEVAARTTVQALNLQGSLPPGRQVLNFEAENLPQPAGSRIYQDRNKGVASGGRYVQVGAAPVTLDFYSASISDGVVDVVLRAASTRAVNVKLSGVLETQQNFGPRFIDRHLGTFFIQEGEMVVEVQLPAGAAIDRLEMRSRRGSRADIMRLVGLADSATISSQDLNNLSALIYRLQDLR